MRIALRRARIANRRFEAIHAIRSHVMKKRFLVCESLRANRPNSRCESPGHLRERELGSLTLEGFSEVSGTPEQLVTQTFPCPSIPCCFGRMAKKTSKIKVLFILAEALNSWTNRMNKTVPVRRLPFWKGVLRDSSFLEGAGYYNSQGMRGKGNLSDPPSRRTPCG